METIELAGTGQYLSRIALGGCPLGGHGWGNVDDADSIAAIRRAYALGVNFFDTADVYGFGHSENILAQALGKNRHRVVISTKFGVRWNHRGETWKDSSPKYLRSALHASLSRLRIDCIPLYYVHWPDEKTPIGDTLLELERCRQEGIIRWIGLSNFSAEQVREAISITSIEALQIQYSLVDRDRARKLLPLAREHGVTLVTWGSLAQGLLTGKYDAKTSFGLNDRRHRYDNFLGNKFAANLHAVEMLQDVANRLGKTPAQVALRWLLDTPGVGVSLFGAKRPAQVEDNVLAAGWQLTTSEYQLLAFWESLANKRAVA